MAPARSTYIQPFRDARGLWRWRLRAANHRILASSEAYSEWRKCWASVGALHGRTALPVDFRFVEASGVLRRMKVRHLEVQRCP